MTNSLLILLSLLLLIKNTYMVNCCFIRCLKIVLLIWVEFIIRKHAVSTMPCAGTDIAAVKFWYTFSETMWVSKRLTCWRQCTLGKLTSSYTKPSLNTKCFFQCESATAAFTITVIVHAIPLWYDTNRGKKCCPLNMYWSISLFGIRGLLFIQYCTCGKTVK